MADYIITAPDGRKYKVSGNGTEQDALKYVQANQDSLPEINGGQNGDSLGHGGAGLNSDSGRRSVVPHTPEDELKPGNTLDAIAEPIATMATGAIAEPVSGIVGMATAPFVGSDISARIINKMREGMTFTPKTEAGQKGLAAVGEVFAPVGEAIENTESYLGDAAYNATGSETLAAGAASIPTAVMSLPVFGGMKGARTASKANKVKVDELRSGSRDVDLADYMIVNGKAVENKLAKDVVAQGWDKASVRTFEAANNATKHKMGQMVDIAEKRKRDALYAQDNRPSDIPGDSLKNRILHIRKVNKNAGSKIDAAANGLKGERVDFSQPIDNFLQGMESMGIKQRADLSLDFSKSDIRGLTGIEAIFNRMNQRMIDGSRNGGMPDAYDLHTMKRYIDQNVAYGKNAEGLTGKAEIIIKQLRHDLDAALDNKFPEYNNVNTTYAETINAINAIQDAAGKKLDLSGGYADKGLGVLMRRLTANVQSRPALLSALDEIESVANKHGGKFDDHLKTQMLLAQQMEELLSKPSAATSLQGEVGKETAKQAQAAANASRSAIGAITETAAWGYDKWRGVNEENALKQLKLLLKRRHPSVKPGQNMTRTN